MNGKNNTVIDGGDGAPVRPATKQEIALLTLLEAGKRGLNTLEAGRAYGETALNSMVSIYRNQYGLLIDGQYESIINRVGKPVTFVRYSLLDDASIKASKKLIDYWRKKRNAPPLFKPKSE